MSAVEIICVSCRADTLLKREAIYDGFVKSGEKLICSNCGYEYSSDDDVLFKEKKADPILFTEADYTAQVEVFDRGETEKLCRYCANYLINPFTQFCSLNKREVQATDTCGQFEKAEKKGSADSII